MVHCQNVYTAAQCHMFCRWVLHLIRFYKQLKNSCSFVSDSHEKWTTCLIVNFCRQIEVGYKCGNVNVKSSWWQTDRSGSGAGHLSALVCMCSPGHTPINASFLTAVMRSEHKGMQVSFFMSGSASKGLRLLTAPAWLHACGFLGLDQRISHLAVSPAWTNSAV